MMSCADQRRCVGRGGWLLCAALAALGGRYADPAWFWAGLICLTGAALLNLLAPSLDLVLADDQPPEKDGPDD